MLSVNGIQKTYEGKLLLDQVSFSVQKGEIVCLLGESGSGKSTLLRIIAGLEKPEGGSVWWNGRDISTLPAHQRGFGLMFQDYALFPHRSVYRNVAFGLRMRGLSEQEIAERVRAALRTIRMEAFADRSVLELSGGEQQRVALARALAPEPHLLMLDEPLGALDHSLRVQLIQELRGVLHQSGVPAIYVTHDREEAFALADRLLILHNGRIVQQGSSQELFDQPADAWVAKFLGLGNLLEGTILSGDPLRIATPLGVFNARACCPDFRTGDACALLLRPGNARLIHNPMGAPNQVEARVVDCVFMGGYYQLTLESADVELNAQTEIPEGPGRLIRLAFPEETTLCLKPSIGASL